MTRRGSEVRKGAYCSSNLSSGWAENRVVRSEIGVYDRLTRTGYVQTEIAKGWVQRTDALLDCLEQVGPVDPS